MTHEELEAIRELYEAAVGNLSWQDIDEPVDDALASIPALLAEVDCLTKERDAVLETLRKSFGSCKYCVSHIPYHPGGCAGIPDGKPCKNWQWRGTGDADNAYSEGERE